jgi:hypothetical protein
MSRIRKRRRDPEQMLRHRKHRPFREFHDGGVYALVTGQELAEKLPQERYKVLCGGRCRSNRLGRGGERRTLRSVLYQALILSSG